MKKIEIDKRFIVNLKGKDFVTYEGLLDMGHQVGLKSIETNLIQIPSADNEYTAIATAKITTEDDKVFEEIGDASPGSVNRMIVPHTIRMSFTRAKARALRDLTNVGMTAIEEIVNDEAPKMQNKILCSSCNSEVNMKIASFSKAKFNKVLCFNCQKRVR